MAKVKRGIQLTISEHSKQRIKERMNIEDKAKIKAVNKTAYHQGINIKEYYIPKYTLQWIDRKVKAYFGRCNCWRIHQNYLFLYSRNLTLVTVIPIPNNLQLKKSVEDLKRW